MEPNVGDLIGYWIGKSILPFILILLPATLISHRNNYSRSKWLLFLIGGSILVMGAAIKLEFVFPLAIGGGIFLGWLLRSEQPREPGKGRDSSPPIVKWFQKNRDNLVAKNYSSETSPERAEEIVHSYANLLARGGRGWIPDAATLPYDKETIRGAIDAFIEYLIEQNGGRANPPTEELEKQINQLGAIKLMLCEFQEIDPEDQEAVTLLNASSPSDRNPPERFDDEEKKQFMAWQVKLLSKYSQRGNVEMDRLGADVTMTVRGSNDDISGGNMNLQ